MLTRQRRDNANFAVEKPQVQEPHTTVHQTSRDGPYVQNQADKIDWVLGALHMMLLLAGVKPAPWPLAPKVDELCNPELNRGMLHSLIEKITRRKANTHRNVSCEARPRLLQDFDVTGSWCAFLPVSQRGNCLLSSSTWLEYTGVGRVLCAYVLTRQLPFTKACRSGAARKSLWQVSGKHAQLCSQQRAHTRLLSSYIRTSMS